MRLWRVVKGDWDAILSLVTAGVFVVVMLRSSRPLEDVRALIIASVPYGVAIATGAMVAGRWASDRIKDSAYGEVIRVLDPSEARMQRPTLTVALAGIATTVVGIALLLTYKEFGRTATVLAYGVLLALALYGAFGLIDLYRQGRRHLARLSLLQSTREEEDRRRRSN